MRIGRIAVVVVDRRFQSLALSASKPGHRLKAGKLVLRREIKVHAHPKIDERGSAPSLNP